MNYWGHNLYKMKRGTMKCPEIFFGLIQKSNSYHLAMWLASDDIYKMYGLSEDMDEEAVLLQVSFLRQENSVSITKARPEEE